MIARRGRFTTLGPVAVLVLGLIAVASACGAEQGGLAPEGSSARDIAWLFWAMTGIGALVVVLVTVVLILARHGRRGSRPADRAPDATPEGSDALVDDDLGAEQVTLDEGPFNLQGRSARLVLGGGVLLPVVVLVPLTVAMLLVATRMVSSGPDPVEIEVVGHQFWWEVRYLDERYPEGVVTANEIHIPVGRDVRLRLRSSDVIHSFWVPQLAGKIDMIPGQTTELIIDADREGEYLGQCAEFCGLQHARMRFLVIAEPPEQWEHWLAEQATEAAPPADAAAARGAEIFDAVGCAACHTVRGTPFQGTDGPDLTHLAGRRSLGAMTLSNTTENLADWVLDPHDAKPGNLMPPTDLAPQQLGDLLAYLEGLR